MKKSLREQLIGAWKLHSYVEVPLDGSEPFYPMSRQPMGIIMYTPDGYMSAQLMTPERKPFAANDFYRGTLEEYRAEGSSYIAYSGPFKVDEETGSLTHSMFVSLFPNWTGQTQPRIVSLEGDVLRLSTANPIQSLGKLVNSFLEWHRAKPE
ncbi:lipocalin-like domain-containing protein [Pseudomonas sp. MAP12]|uniref:Lipocalin-like domain-containing protein n=1 Tax=Geopseudomonas aromaticivorans TaxID=2849492 RepID=A0ABS6MTK0_9GAMM|nr:lipocalin-like domain-containing protein [Pseudomonas aromaticivorans]MBV2132138.1 lipocalin-like domain-containing protein [Pseudomonas aromaticivorans]